MLGVGEGNFPESWGETGLKLEAEVCALWVTIWLLLSSVAITWSLSLLLLFLKIYLASYKDIFIFFPCSFDLILSDQPFYPFSFLPAIFSHFCFILPSLSHIILLRHFPADACSLSLVLPPWRADDEAEWMNGSRRGGQRALRGSLVERESSLPPKKGLWGSSKCRAGLLGVFMSDLCKGQISQLGLYVIGF